METVVFITLARAQYAGELYKNHVPDCLGYVVREYHKRGEMQGYRVFVMLANTDYKSAGYITERMLSIVEQREADQVKARATDITGI